MVKSKNKSHPHNHKLWKYFENTAHKYGIPLEYQEDWQAWWDVYLAGAQDQLEDMQNNLIEKEKRAFEKGQLEQRTEPG